MGCGEHVWVCWLGCSMGGVWWSIVCEFSRLSGGWLCGVVIIGGCRSLLCGAFVVFASCECCFYVTNGCVCSMHVYVDDLTSGVCGHEKYPPSVWGVGRRVFYRRGCATVGVFLCYLVRVLCVKCGAVLVCLFWCVLGCVGSMCSMRVWWMCESSLTGVCGTSAPSYGCTQGGGNGWL